MHQLVSLQHIEEHHAHRHNGIRGLPQEDQRKAKDEHDAIHGREDICCISRASGVYLLRRWRLACFIALRPRHDRPEKVIPHGGTP